MLTTFVEEPQTYTADGYGYQYVTMVDPSGSDNGVVGRTFYVYSAKFVPTGPVVYRWLVTLNQ